MTIAGEVMPKVGFAALQQKLMLCLWCLVPGKHLQSLASKPSPARLSDQLLIILPALAQNPGLLLVTIQHRPVGLKCAISIVRKT